MPLNRGKAAVIPSGLRLSKKGQRGRGAEGQRSRGAEEPPIEPPIEQGSRVLSFPGRAWDCFRRGEWPFAPTASCYLLMIDTHTRLCLAYWGSQGLPGNQGIGQRTTNNQQPTTNNQQFSFLCVPLCLCGSNMSL